MPTRRDESPSRLVVKNTKLISDSQLYHPRTPWSISFTNYKLAEYPVKNMLPHQQTRPNKSRKLENLAILLLQDGKYDDSAQRRRIS